MRQTIDNTSIRCASSRIRFLRSTHAASSLEYALLVGIVATVIAAAIVVFSGSFQPVFTTIAAEVTESAGEVDD